MALTLVSKSLCPWMRTGVCRSKARRLNPSVDLGGRDGCVSKQLLDRAQVGAALEQMGCERVPQRVRVGVGQRRSVRGGLARPQRETAADVAGVQPPSRLR